jgi:gluconolactonase
MQFKLVFWIAVLAILQLALARPVMVVGQQPGPDPVPGKIVREDPRLDQLVPSNAVLEVLASGFQWAEGPVWIKEGSFLLFSDVPRNSIMKWKEDTGITLFMHPSGYTGVADYGHEPGSNGLTVDPRGRLVLCEHGDRRISRMEWDGGKQTIVDNYLGKRLNSPNDLIFKSTGDLYFTDPAYGLPKYFEDPRRELDFCGVYRVQPGGKISLLTREMTRPNGLAFSPDEKILYVAQSDAKQALWMAFPVLEDGLLGKGRIFNDVTSLVDKLPGLPDGMKVDCHGNLFATGPGGVHIIAPDGTRLGRIETGQPTGNCAWGEDGSSLFITANHYLCRIRTRTKGAGW